VTNLRHSLLPLASNCNFPQNKKLGYISGFPPEVRREPKERSAIARPSDYQALSVAEALLGRRPDRLEAFHPAVGGDDSYSFRLALGREEMLLKIKRHTGSPVGIYFHSRLKQAGLPVPELIAFRPDAGPNREACAIWEWIDGEPAEWGEGEPCPYDEAELGELLKRIHALEFDGAWGFLGDDLSARYFTPNPDLGPVSDTWFDFFHCERAARRYFKKGYLSRRKADQLAALPRRLAELYPARPRRLLHMSDIMHNGNLLVRDRRIVAIVDYVESLAGDPRWELAWFDYYFADFPFGEATFDLSRFRAAYGDNPEPDDLARFYLLGILLFEKLLWFDPASPRGAWALNKAKDLISELAAL
jgi:hypothetical protein